MLPLASFPLLDKKKGGVRVSVQRVEEVGLFVAHLNEGLKKYIILCGKSVDRKGN